MSTLFDNLKVNAHDQVMCPVCKELVKIHNPAIYNVECYCTTHLATGSCGHAFYIMCEKRLFARPYLGDRNVDEWNNPITKFFNRKEELINDK